MNNTSLDAFHLLHVYWHARCCADGRDLYTGTVLVAASVAVEYGFTDIDGKTPRPLTLADV
jgi:hypothetical protein